MERPFPKNKHYVYEHWLDNECVYVGKGSGYRAFNLSVKRCQQWFDIVGNRKKDLIIKIVKEFDTSSEAFKFEEELTKYYKELGQCKGVYKISNINPEEVNKAKSILLKEKFKGKNNPMYGKTPHNKGKHLPEEQKLKISNNQRKHLQKVFCKNNNMIFQDAIEASKYFKIDRRTVKHSCKNNSKTRDGYEFKYIE